MSILSKSFQVNFTQVPNQIINDERVSLKAKGLYLFFVSKPDDWEFSLSGMTSQLKESKDTIISIINELCKFGYIDKVKNRNGSRQGLNDYILHLEPHRIPYSPPESKNQSLKIRVGKSESENSTTSNTKKSNTKKSNTSTSNKKKISFNQFRELFFNSEYRKGFTISLPPWSLNTGFRIDRNKMIYNTVSCRLVSKDEAYQIWQYLYSKYLNNEIKGI